MPKFQYIRDICARVVLAGDKEQFQAAVNELKIALGQHAMDELFGNPAVSSSQKKPGGGKAGSGG